MRAEFCPQFMGRKFAKKPKCPYEPGMQNTNEFQTFLQQEFARRKRRNPNYSLRAFAKSLEMDDSTLCKVVHGERKAGKAFIRRVGVKLGLDPEQLNVFIENPKQQTTQDQVDYQKLTIEASQVIADWYHYAILELLRLREFRLDTAWIAQTLNISTLEVEKALERLQSSRMIAIDDQGHVEDLTTVKTTNIVGQFTSWAQKNLQKEVLSKAIDAIEEVPYELRSNTSMTMAIDTAKLPQAIEMIKEFRRNLAQLLSRGSEPNQVYNLGIALYPLTNIENKSDGEIEQ